MQARSIQARIREAHRGARIGPAGGDCELPPKRVWRELPFALRAGPLVIRGAIDLLCVLDDCLLVVDYKRGPPRARAGYRAQVDIYALAASRIVGEQPGEQPGEHQPEQADENDVTQSE